MALLTWIIAHDMGRDAARDAVAAPLAVPEVAALRRGRGRRTRERDPESTVTILGLVVYIAVVAGFLVLLDVS